MNRIVGHAVLLLLLASVSSPVRATGELEVRVQEIERVNRTAPWRESEALVRALSPHLDELTPDQRSRIGLVTLRNLALSGEHMDAVEGMHALLRQEMAPETRVRAHAVAVNLATNVGDYALAFTWLRDGLAAMADAPGSELQVLGVAAYLHTYMGDSERARDFAQRALALATGAGDTRAHCIALADLALVEDHADDVVQSELLRRRQIDVCGAAGDPVLVASGLLGVGEMLGRQGRHAESLAWSRRAMEAFDAAGYESGLWGSRLSVARALIALGEDPGEAEALLETNLSRYRAQGSSTQIVIAESLLSTMAERAGDADKALLHLKRTISVSEQAEREARERRLAYLQVEFNTTLKEQQIALLEAERELAALQVSTTRRWQVVLALGVVALLFIAALLSGLLRRSIRQRRRYRWLSERDGLTRLYNYQQVRRLGEGAFARARAARRPFTAIVADIDLFKQVNDSYGHAAGDEALRALGAWIAEVVGERGIAGRSGGDEFTLLLDADAEEASEVLQRLRQRIEPITVFGQTLRFDISAGLCQADGSEETLEQLIHRADKALYRAKHGGRDQVVQATPDDADSAASARPRGELVVVGSGIQFGRHVSERSLSEIREAEVVFCLVDPFALAMIRSFRPDAVNLGTHYAVGKDRRQTYREIDAAIMVEVRAGKRVCAVFYGHPGVFADVPHRVVQKARAEGVAARMEPGISAEACLYADLGIDPGKRGVQSMEATHFLVYDRRIDPGCMVLLWQVALSGDLSCTRFHAEREGLQALVGKLLRWYPPEHEVILYEAARLPVEEFRAERLRLCDLAAAHYEEYTTLVIPPLGELSEDPTRGATAASNEAGQRV